MMGMPLRLGEASAPLTLCRAPATAVAARPQPQGAGPSGRPMLGAW